MSIIDQINDIVADGNISKAEKRRIIAAFRSGYVRDRLAELNLPKVFIRGQFTVILTKVELRKTALYSWLYVTRRGQEIKIDYPIIITSPPLLVSDPAGTIVIGDQTYRLDPVQAYQNIIADVIQAAFQAGL